VRAWVPRNCRRGDPPRRHLLTTALVRFIQESPNFQALFRDLPDLTPPRAKMSYSTFTGASPSTSEFGFPRLATEISPAKQRMGIELLQRATPANCTLLSPSSRNILGMPPLPIFQPSPLRGLSGGGQSNAIQNMNSQASTFLSPDASSKDPNRRLSDVSEFQRFSLSPAGDPRERRSSLSSAFADIMDGNSRVSPKDYNVKIPGLSSDEKESSPPQLAKREHRDRVRKSMDFSNFHLSPTKQEIPFGVSPILGNDCLLPIHPLQKKQRNEETATKNQLAQLHSPRRDDNAGVQSAHAILGSPSIYSTNSMDALTSAQSPVRVKLGIMRPEDIIHSPAVKQATDAAVAAAMKASKDFGSRNSSQAAAARAAASMPIGFTSRRSSRRESSNHSTKIDPGNLLYSGPIAHENTGGTRCKCKKSKCLKLYCECFKAKGYCGPECSCTCCQNKAGHEDLILEAREGILQRNPLAFTEKIAETTISTQGGDEQIHSQHTLGCKCKKSRCEKKYCECFQAGVLCSDHCKCTGCLNCVKSSGETKFANEGMARKKRKTHSTRNFYRNDLPIRQPNRASEAIAGLTPLADPGLHVEK
jgi:hypothetical protein